MIIEFEKCLARGREMTADGARDVDLLQYFRNQGASMMESVKLMQQVKQTSLKEAQDTVHYSEVWSDEKASHDASQNALIEAAKELANTLKRSR
jgi:hypothetical protein